MASTTVNLLKSVNISTEFACAEMGDKRLTKRLKMITAAMSVRPECSNPQVFDTHAELEGYYRFVENKNIRWRAIFEPHQTGTLERAAHFKKVLVLHDTTEISFKIHDDNPLRKHMPRVSSKTQGFCVHASLCCSADGLRAPLGLLAMQPFAHKKECTDADDPAATLAFWAAQDGIYDNEQRRWLNGFLESEEALRDQGLRGVHVADREADSYGLISPLCERGIDFVFRIFRKRFVEDTDAPNEELELLETLIAAQKPLGRRPAQLGARAEAKDKRLQKRFPKRRSRQAILEFRSKKIVMPRPVSQPDTMPPEATVWAVEAREIDPPDGEGVYWLLVTNQCAETLEQTLEIVDQYRARWVVEELFKSLKSGQNYEKLQHDNAHTLLNALAIKSVIAWQALVLRYFARHYPDFPAQMVVTRVQLLILRQKKTRLFKQEQPTVHEAMMAVASLGGHIKNNGDPGWAVIQRGLRQLNDMCMGWMIATEYAEKM